MDSTDPFSAYNGNHLLAFVRHSLKNTISLWPAFDWEAFSLPLRKSHWKFNLAFLFIFTKDAGRMNLCDVLIGQVKLSQLFLQVKLKSSWYLRDISFKWIIRNLDSVPWCSWYWWVVLHLVEPLVAYFFYHQYLVWQLPSHQAFVHSTLLFQNCNLLL